MAGLLEYKSIPITTKNAIINVDEAEGTIEGYAAVFGNKDSDGDIMQYGFFTKTLTEDKGRIKHLWQHDSWRPLSGTNKGNLELTQDDYGLRFKSTVSKTSWGRDAIRLHLDGVIDENSIGFQTTQFKDTRDFESRTLIECKLWELSSVTWAANPLAKTLSAKSMTKDELFTKMNTVMKAIRNGKYENEDLYDSLDLYFKQLQTLINELSTKAAAEAPKPDEDIDAALSIFRQLKTI